MKGIGHDQAQHHRHIDGPHHPKDRLLGVKVGKGDTLYAVAPPDGGYRLTPYDPLFARRMEAAEDIMRRYRNALHVLAK
jgi:hypothetical protein